MGEKIKIKDIEGDSEEVIRLFSSSDCSLSEYLNANKPIKIPLIAIGILVVVFFIINCVLWILPMEYEATRKILILASFLLGGIGTIMVHMNWKKFCNNVCYCYHCTFSSNNIHEYIHTRRSC